MIDRRQWRGFASGATSILSLSLSPLIRGFKKNGGNVILGVQ